MRPYNIRGSLRAAIAALVAVLALLTMPVRVEAKHIVPDLDATGSIAVSMVDPDTQDGVGGGTLTLMRVGDVAQDNGDFSFALAPDFAASGASLATPDAELAEHLAAFAQERGIEGATLQIPASGRVVFDDLPLGLYLLVQRDAAEGYYAVSPFLVSVPIENAAADAYVYDVDATPKMELLDREPPTPSEEEPPSRWRLPRTGEELLPYVGIAVVGVAAVAGGVLLRRRRSE